MLGAAVALWIAGFDLFYSLFDVEVDRAQGLHSWAVRLGERGVFRGARVFHVATVLLLAAVGLGARASASLYWLGVAAVAGLLVYEHSLIRPGDLRRLDAAFFTVNGVISVVFCAFVIADVLVQCPFRQCAPSLPAAAKRRLALSSAAPYAFEHASSLRPSQACFSQPGAGAHHLKGALASPRDPGAKLSKRYGERRVLERSTSRSSAAASCSSPGRTAPARRPCCGSAPGWRPRRAGSARGRRAAVGGRLPQPRAARLPRADAAREPRALRPPLPRARAARAHRDAARALRPLGRAAHARSRRSRAGCCSGSRSAGRSCTTRPAAAGRALRRPRHRGRRARRPRAARPARRPNGAPLHTRPRPGRAARDIAAGARAR